MSPYKQPPLSCRFVEGRSGNPLGRPKKLRDTELLLMAIKFSDELARAYYANGELIQEGQEATFYAKRNHTTQIMVTADGYYPAYKQVGPELNILGILDIIGGLVWLVPFIGLAFPGAKSLDNNNIAIHMVKMPTNQ